MHVLFDYYASNGGYINGAIFLVAVVTLYIGSGKLLQFKSYRKLMQKPWGEGFYAAERNTDYLKVGENHIREKLLEVLPEIDSGLDTMAALIKTAPLLGLFGTVVGMIKTFSLITTFGTANPVVLTEGITVSLLTTQAGLLVAFPCMLFHNYVKNRKDVLVQDIITKAEADVKFLSTENIDK
jgi:biopolymer transport protein ExbB/TolQ